MSAATRTIWKYTLEIADEQTLEMPAGAEMLTVGSTNPGDGSRLDLWAAVDPGAPREPRMVHIRGTGHRHGVVGRYIGTVVVAHGALVWHVFDARWCGQCGRHVDAPACGPTHALVAHEAGITSRTFAQDEAARRGGEDR